MPNLSGHTKFTAGLYIAAGAAIGALAWCGNIYFLPLVVLLPIVLKMAKIRPHRIALVLAYHAGATWPMLPGARLFFGEHLSVIATALMWLVIVCVLSLPWIAFCSWTGRGNWTLTLGIPAALLVCSVLPTGIENPLAASGVLFPGTSWVGLMLTIGVFAIIPLRPIRVLFAAAVISLVCHLLHPGAPSTLDTWQGINTSFGGAGFGMPDPMTEYENALRIQQIALESKAKVIVFPETVVYRWNDSTDAFWRPTFVRLKAQGKTVLVGANESVPATENNYRNMIEVRGSQFGKYQQHVPLPVGMWQPFSNEGVPLDLSGPYVIRIGNETAAPLICYEQLLGLPAFRAMLHHPTVLIGISNEYWSRGTIIPAIQAESLQSWSRLFWVPVVSAVNQ